MTGQTPRVAPGGRREVGLYAWVISRGAARATKSGPPNLFLTLGRHKRLFRGWFGFARQLMPSGLLPRRETELVILRVAHLSRCTYEWRHHVRLARRAGVSAAEVNRIGTDASPEDGWSARERAVLQAVDELHEQRDLGDRAWQALREHLDERECIELCLLVGHYTMLATTIAALRVQPD